MHRSSYSLTLSILLCLGSVFAKAETPPQPSTVPPAAILVDDEANRGLKVAMDAKYADLMGRWTEWMRRKDAFNATYRNRKFPKGSPQALAGAAEETWLEKELGAYTDTAAWYERDLRKVRVDRQRSIASMSAFLERQGLDRKKVERAKAIMTAMRLDGVLTIQYPELVATWKVIEARDGDRALGEEATAGEGPTLSGIGTQSFNDCTIFALAAAIGRPYGLVAVQATRMIAKAEWRGEADHKAPQGVIERHGLNGDEVTLLAESFGQAELVPTAAFAKTLRARAPVMVAVSVPAGLHQVVLSRTFQHDGKTWFEMIDSNLSTRKRRYLSEKELFSVLYENGVSYRPDPGYTPKLLRPATDQ